MDINYELFEDLHVTINAAFRQALLEQPETEWQRVATRLMSGSGKNLYPILKQLGGMREWLGDAIFEEIATGRYELVNRKFQKGLTLDRDEMMDDAGGLGQVYGIEAGLLASAVASHADELVMAEALANGETGLCYDDQPFFDTAHPSTDPSIAAQSNLIAGGGTPWYLFDTSKPIKPLIYQVREDLRLDRMFDPTNEVVFTQHKFRYNAWQRDCAGYGPWHLAVKSYATLDYAGLKAAIERMDSFHLGVADELTASPRNARAKATLLVVPKSLRFTARDLLEQANTSTGETNQARGLVDYMVSDYL